MMEGRIRLLSVLALAGIAFSGYLSSVRFFSETCAFSEPCPYFLGYPACYFGFSLFVLIGIAILMGVLGAMTRNGMLGSILALSGTGVLFAGYFTVPEVASILTEGLPGYTLGLPTCSYGLLVFLGVFGIALAERMQRRG